MYKRQGVTAGDIALEAVHGGRQVGGPALGVDPFLQAVEHTDAVSPSKQKIDGMGAQKAWLNSSTAALLTLPFTAAAVTEARSTPSCEPMARFVTSSGVNPYR